MQTHIKKLLRIQLVEGYLICINLRWPSLDFWFTIYIYMIFQQIKQKTSVYTSFQYNVVLDNLGGFHISLVI